MHKYLTEMLECPICHGTLEWNITKESINRIEEGEAYCKVCKASYPIKNEIGIFLTPKLQRNDLWEQGNNEMAKLFSENPKLEDKLMNSPLTLLGPADQFIRAMVLEEREQCYEARDIFKIAWRGIYTEDYINCWNKQMEYICKAISSTNEPVIDLASGRCYLVEELVRKTNNFIVATDFSPRVLHRNRLVLKHLGLYDKVSLISFDARLTPFKDNVVNIMTSNLGLINIEQPGELLKELRRIINGKLMAVMSFCSEKDEKNSKVLYDAGVETFAFRSLTIENFTKTGWKVGIVNGCFGQAKPTPKGQIIKDLMIDGFPIEDTVLEWGTLIAK